MVGPRAPLGKLTDHLKGMLGSRPAEGSAPKPSLSDLKNGGKGDVFDDSDVESSDSDSESSDSDSDGDNKSNFLRKIGATTASASPLKPKTNGTVSTAKAAPKVPAKTNGAAAKKENTRSESSPSTNTSSSEADSDSSESEEEKKEEEVKKHAQNTKKPGGAASPSESSSSEDSSTSEEESSESEEEVVAPKAKVAKPKPASKPAAVAASTSTSSSEPTSSDSSRESSVESESKEDEEVPAANVVDSDEEMADQSFAITTRENGDSEVANSASQFATQGFQLRRADESNDASDVARIFHQAKLEGKQLWYFTAPASVPITVVEQMAIPVAKAEQGKAILSHEGEDYGMSFDDSLTSRTIKVLIPNKAGDKYSTLDRTIDKTMHLKRVTRFALDGDGAGAGNTLAVQAPVSAKKPPRKQPEGLRARFLPIGVNDSASSKKRKHSDDASTTKATSKAVDSDDESDGGAVVKAAEPSLKKAKKDKSADKSSSPKKDKKSASVVPLPPIPGLNAAAAPAHKVTPVAPPVLPVSALKASAAPASEKTAKKSKSSDSNILPSSSQISYSQIDTPSKIVVDDKVMKKSKDKKAKKQEAEADDDAMDIDDVEAKTESSPKKHKKEKKDKSEKSEKKKDKKEKKEKKERKAAKSEVDIATPVASLSASASQPKKVTPVPVPRF
ncbi:hypothetical protein SEUCBS139899_004614 [Sporothrix eucalyptigena]